MHVQLAPDRGKPQPCFDAQVIMMTTTMMIMIMTMKAMMMMTMKMRQKFRDCQSSSCLQLLSGIPSQNCLKGFKFRINNTRNVVTMTTMMTISQMHSHFQGFKLKMDDMGNILIKRLSKSPVYARNTLEVNRKHIT